MRPFVAALVAAAAGYLGAPELMRALQYLLAAQLYDVLGDGGLLSLTICVGLVTAAMAWPVADYALGRRDQKLLRMRIYRIAAGAALLFTLFGVRLALDRSSGFPPSWRELSRSREALYYDQTRQSLTQPCTPHACTLVFLALKRGDQIDVSGASPFTVRRHAQHASWNDSPDWGPAIALPAGARSFRADRSGWYSVAPANELCVQLKH